MVHIKSGIKDLVMTIEKADSGDYKAMFELVSNCYALGWDCDNIDDEIGQRILGYIKKLAELGKPVGYIWLADAYRTGDLGLKVNLKIANEYYEKAISLAEKTTEVSPAYEAIADNYYYGNGVNINYKEAYKKI